jgi:hypothetical protein
MADQVAITIAPPAYIDVPGGTTGTLFINSEDGKLSLKKPDGAVVLAVIVGTDVTFVL